jgi:hypothetical protein
MRALLVGSLGFWSGCFVSCQQPLLQQGTCTPSGAAAQVDALELGASEEAAFTPLADGDPVNVVVGGQGATMIIVRLRVRGAPAPLCLPQSTSVTAPDDPLDVLARSDASLATNLESDGSRSTGQLLLPGRYPSPGGGIAVTTRAGGQTVTRLLSVGVAGFYDFEPAPDGSAAVEDLGGSDGAGG